LACDKDENDSPENRTASNFFFQDGFETQNNSLVALFPSDESRWSKIQQTNPSNETNEISIIDSESSEGENSLRFLSYQSDFQLSKIAIEKGD